MISVIMPVYNAAKFIKQSIDSILRQTETDLELIIVNDGSTDDSEDIVLSCDDSRIVYIKQDNSGVASARNKGLAIAKGELIAWQDADDISLPTRLEIMQRGFDSPSVGFVHSDMLLVDETDRTVGYLQSQNITAEYGLRFFLKIGTPFNNASMLMKKELLNDFHHDTTLHIGSDSDMVFTVTRGWKSVHIPEPLYLYRRHSSNLTKKYNYEQVAAHVKKFLARHSLEELVPELNWQPANNPDNNAKAHAIISLLLLRRGLSLDASEWLEKAKDVECGLDGRLFVRAISLITNGSYELARQVLQSCPVQDHVAENYFGEIAAFSGDTNSAYKSFMKALDDHPHYIEPIDNLRGLGGLSNLQLVDTSWLKYKQVS
jgi:glycosyltransferase involved in cell wall biosynthesis